MSIKAKLLAIFLSIVVTTVIIATLFFLSAKDTLNKLKVEELTSIANLKKDRVESYFEKQKVEIRSFQNFFMVKKYLPVLEERSADKSSREYVDAERQLYARLKPFESLGYSDVILAGPDGRVLFSTNESHWENHEGRPLAELDANAFEQGRKGVYFSDVFRDSFNGNSLCMVAAGPLHDFENRFIGVVALEVSMDELYAELQDTTGLGVTGETIICRKAGADCLVLNPLRHDRDAALKRVIRLVDYGETSAQDADRRKGGRVVTTDYRGSEVVYGLKHVPTPGWELIVKADTAETSFLIRWFKRLAVVSAVITVIISLLGVGIIHKYITEPILELQRGTEIIGSGDLGHRVGTPASDEIGKLSRAFDRMTDNLKKVTTSRDELRDSENRLRAIIDNIPDIAWLKDVEGRFVSVNEAFGRACGIAPEEITGKTDFDIWEYDMAAKYSADDRAVIEGGVRKRFDEPLVDKNGNMTWIETIKTPIYSDRGTPLGTIGIARDVTERKELEKKKADFYAMVTHDMKSPLVGILGYTELILDEKSGALDADTRELIGRVHESGEKMNRMVEDFLSVSRIENGRLEVLTVPTDLAKILREVHAGLERHIRDKDIAFSLEIAEDLPSGILLDQKLVQRAVFNLLQNAVNYTPQGGSIKLSAGRGAAGDEGCVVISVADSGPGIPADEQAMVFEKYYRSPRTARVKGTGLGLAIVKAVAEAHGGRAELTSEVDKGSTFRIFLPIS